MAKKSGHSVEKVAGIYGVNKSRIEAFLLTKGKKATDRIFGTDNNELARFFRNPQYHSRLRRRKGKLLRLLSL